MLSWCPRSTRKRSRLPKFLFESLEERITPVLYFTADLAVEQTNTGAGVGQEISMEYTVTNNGIDSITSFTLTDSDLTDSVENQTYTPSAGAYDELTGVFTLDTPLAPGESVTLTRTGSVANDASGTLVNTVVVSGATGLFDPDQSNNTSEVNINVLADLTDLSISKTSDATNDIIPKDGTVTYSIVVTNNGPTDVTGAQVTDMFPDDLTAITWTAAASTGSSVTDANGAGDIDTTVDLLDGGSATFTVNATAVTDFTGTISNTAEVTAPDDVFDTDTTNNTSTNDLTVAEVADLMITKDNSVGDFSTAGSTISYIIVVTNNGPTDVEGAEVIDVFPDELTNVTWTAAADAGSSVAQSAGSGNINTTVDLVSGESATFTVTATIDDTLTGGTVVLNTARVAAPDDRFDPDQTNNVSDDSITLSQSGDLSITKQNDSNDVVGEEGTFNYTIVVTNSDSNDTVEDVPVMDTFPASLINVTWDAVATAGSTVTDASGVDVIDTTVTLAPNGSVTFTVEATVDTGIVDQDIENTATLTVPDGFVDTNPDNNSATDTVTVLQVADLTISKTNDVGDTKITAGTEFTYTIIVTNDGPTDVTGASVVDMFPAGLTNVTWTAAASGGSTVTDSSGSGDIDTTVDLLDSGSATFTVTATVGEDQIGGTALDNTATVTAPADRFDPDTANNSASSDLIVAEEVDLAITKTNDVGTESIAGATVTYTIEVTNNGPVDVTGAVVQDSFPAELTNVTWTAAASAGSAVTDASGSGDIDTTVDLLDGGAATFTVTATISDTLTAGTTVVNTANVAPPEDRIDTVPGNDMSSDTITLTPSGDLTISKVNDADNSAIEREGSFQYTIIVTNTGNDTVTDAQVADMFPADLINVQWTAEASAGSSVTDTSGIGDIDTTVTLDAGGTVTFTVDATAGEGFNGDIVNTATVTAPGDFTDPDESNNTSTNTLVVGEADLSINKTSDVDAETIAGREVTYTIVVTNNGPSPVTGATVEDMFPAQLTDVSWTAEASAGSSVTDTSGVGNIDTTVDLLNGGDVTFTVTATIDPGLIAGTAVLNTATVTSPETSVDPDNTNNLSDDSFTLAPSGDLSITKDSDIGDTPLGGDTFTYTIVVTNPGNDTATDAQVVDPFPAGLTNITWTAAASAGSSVTDATGEGDIDTTVTLLPGGDATFTVNATIEDGFAGDIDNTATVIEPAGFIDPNVDNNTANNSFTALLSGDLSITKDNDSGDDTVTENESFQYSIVVGNSDDDTATGATVTDNFPNGLTNITWTAAASEGSSVTDESGTGDIDTTVTLLPEGNVTFTVNATVEGGFTGDIDNTATVTAPANFFDTDETNNEALDEIFAELAP